MMEKQISKKKLERLAIVGGDFSRVLSKHLDEKKRSGGMSLSRLRRLLEDDVRNLKRMSKGMGIKELVDTTTKSSGQVASSDMVESEEGVSFGEGISEEELDLVMSREKLFDALAYRQSSDGKGGGDEEGARCSVALEGDMYDILNGSAAGSDNLQLV